MAAPQVPSLIISGLPFDAHEGTILKHFERIDKSIKIKSVSVLRDPYTGKSFCSGRIKFFNPYDANRALDLGNFTYILSREITLTKYNPEFMRDRSIGNVFVKNLAPTTRSSDLYRFFKKLGPVFSCKVKYSHNGECMGYGYVRFEDQVSANRAIEAANGQELLGNKLEVCPFRTRENRANGSAAYNNLYIRGIPRNYSNTDLARLFQPFGEILSAVAIKASNEATENKGFGFVCFKDPEAAKKAEEAMNHNQVAGEELYVCRALPMENRKKTLREERFQAYKDCNVYVKSFPESTTDEELKSAFEEFGKVLSARVMTKRLFNTATNQTEVQPMGYGFVCFESREDANRAVEVSTRKPILGQMLYVAIAQKREERNPRFRNPIRPPYHHGFNPRYPQFNMRSPYPMYYPPPQHMPMRPPMPHMMPPQYMPPFGVPMAPMQQPPVQPPALPTDKEQLGETLYPLVSAINESHAAKITGMLLEMEIEQIHKFILDANELHKWVEEAYKTIVSSKDAESQKN